jgi:hypothetical protein
LAIPPLLAAGPSPSVAQLRYPFLPVMETVPDARGAALGRAFTAVAEGPSAVWWNPGALALPSPWSAQLVTNLTRTRWTESNDLDVYAVSGRLREVGLAAHLMRLGEGEETSGRHRSWDLLCHLGAGVDLAERVGLGSPDRVRWGVGVSAKSYAIAFHEGPFRTSRRNYGRAIDADVGSLLALRLPLVRGARGDIFALEGPAVPFAGLRAGVTLRNAFDAEIDRIDGLDRGTPLGQQVRAGIALEAGTARWKSLGPVLAGTFSAEMVGDIESASGSPTRCYGIELRILDALSLRYGETRDELWDFQGVSRGLGLRLGLPGRAGIRLDWAHVPYPGGRLYRPEMLPADAEQFSGSIWFVP